MYFVFCPQFFLWKYGGGGGELVDLLHNTLSFFQKVTNCYKGGGKGRKRGGKGGKERQERITKSIDSALVLADHFQILWSKDDLILPPEVTKVCCGQSSQHSYYHRGAYLWQKDGIFTWSQNGH